MFTNPGSALPPSDLRSRKLGQKLLIKGKIRVVVLVGAQGV